MGIQYSFRRYEKKYVLSPRQQEQLLQRIALKDLAAYLFLTPQSLSRIRAEIK